MTGRFKSFAAGALATAALLAASQAEAGHCRLGKYFDLPVAMEGPRAIVTAKVNGIDARFFVDTGAFHSMITPKDAKRLKLEDMPAASIVLTGVGGSTVGGVGVAKEFRFANYPLKRAQFILAGSEFAPGTVGLIGEDLLSFADVEYDFANGMMRYFHAHDCSAANLGYWTPDHVTDFIPIRSTGGAYESIKGRVKINGQWVLAEFDTGSPTSMLSTAAARRAGVRPDGQGAAAAGLASGIGKGVVETWNAPIATFTIGSEEIRNTRLSVGRLDLDDVDMLLGMDFFLSHHILVAHSQDKLYFTYNGGAVFRLDEPSQSPGGDTPAHADPAAPAAGTPADPEALARQGDALMSRRDYAAALRAFDAAVKLEPKEPARFVERATAEEALGKTDKAFADYAQALALKPNDATVLLARGELYLGEDEPVKAGADFEAAVKAAPDGGDLQLRIADAYEANERYAEAIPHFDVWIAGHPHDEALWEALNTRCWARAMLGKELDKALADCELAARKGPRNSEVLDSRGMVRLRLGQYREAIADYDAALRLQPKLPWSLYGRGLAKQKLGMTAEGEADIHAAVALEPNLPKRAQRVGLIESKAAPAPAAKPGQAGKS